MKPKPPTQLGHRRRGISIAEVVIAASSVSVLSVIGITVVCLLMTAEQRAMESIVIERTIGELADELRQDAHLARGATLNDAHTSLTLHLPDGSSVTYLCTDDSVHRSDATERQEQFHLPFGQSRFELTFAERLIVWRHEREPVLDMSLSEPSTEIKTPRRMYRIDAALLTDMGTP